MAMTVVVIVSVAPRRLASNSTSCGNGNAAISSGWRAKSKLAARTPPSSVASCRSTCHPAAAARRPCIGSPLGSRFSVVASSRSTVAAGDREPRPGDAIRPGVQKRDPHRRALLDVGAQAAALAQQLLPPMAERAPDHAGAGDEGRLDAAVGARQGQRRNSVDRSCTDHVAPMMHVAPRRGSHATAHGQPCSHGGLGFATDMPRKVDRSCDCFVIFGITGDLAKVMTFHSLYRLEQRGLLDCPIVGVAVDDWSEKDLREQPGRRSRPPRARSPIRRSSTASPSASPTSRATSPTTRPTGASPTRSRAPRTRSSTWRSRRRCSG